MKRVVALEPGDRHRDLGKTPAELIELVFRARYHRLVEVIDDRNHRREREPIEHRLDALLAGCHRHHLAGEGAFAQAQDALADHPCAIFETEHAGSCKRRHLAEAVTEQGVGCDAALQPQLRGGVIGKVDAELIEIAAAGLTRGIAKHHRQERLAENVTGGLVDGVKQRAQPWARGVHATEQVRRERTLPGKCEYELA